VNFQGVAHLVKSFHLGRHSSSEGSRRRHLLAQAAAES
jgi:hypothetical protein